MTKRPVSHDITWTWTSKWKEQEENLWESQGYLHYYAQLSVKIYILCIIFWRHENVLPCLRAILIASTDGLTMCCTSSITDTTSGHQPYITKSTDWTLNSQKATFTMIFSSLSAIIGNCFVTIAEEDGNQRHSLILCREIWDCAISDQPPSYQGMAERQLEVSWFLNTTCTNVHPLLTGAMGALGYHTVRYLGKRTTALPGLWTFHQTDFPAQFDRL